MRVQVRWEVGEDQQAPEGWKEGELGMWYGRVDREKLTDGSQSDGSVVIKVKDEQTRVGESCDGR